VERCLLRSDERIQTLHQTAFAAGGVALVDHSTRGGLIQIAQGRHGGGFGEFQITLTNGGTCLLHQRARAATENPIVHLAALGLADALDRRFMISHGRFLKVEPAVIRRAHFSTAV
jgi:hypothetical protein